MNKYITVKEYCKLTGLHKNTVYKRVKDGYIDALPGAKGSKILISSLEIPTYMRKLKVNKEEK